MSNRSCLANFHTLHFLNMGLIIDTEYESTNFSNKTAINKKIDVLFTYHLLSLNKDPVEKVSKFTGRSTMGVD